MPDSIPLPPITANPAQLGEAGAAIRDRALVALTARHHELLERSKRRHLTGPERSELDRLGVILDTLAAM